MTEQDLAELEQDLEKFGSGYRVGMADALKTFLEEWGLGEDDPGRLRAEKRLLPILERSIEEIIGELDRALRPLVESSGD